MRGKIELIIEDNGKLNCEMSGDVRPNDVVMFRVEIQKAYARYMQLLIDKKKGKEDDSGKQRTDESGRRGRRSGTEL